MENKSIQEKTNQSFENLINQPYKYGFETKIETEKIKPGLNEEL